MCQRLLHYTSTEEPRRRGALLDPVLTKEKLMGKVILQGSLVCCDHEMVKFQIISAVKRVCNKLTTLDFRRAHFGLFMDLLSRHPQDRALEDRVAQECWLIFKGYPLQAQEPCIPVRMKSGKNAKRPHGWIRSF